MVLSQADASKVPGFDPARYYVRLLRMCADGFVEFEFLVGAAQGLARSPLFRNI